LRGFEFVLVLIQLVKQFFFVVKFQFVLVEFLLFEQQFVERK